MSINQSQRARRNAQIEGKKPAIAALYHQAKSDEEIASTLGLDILWVRLARDGMFLPPLRSASGALFTPEIDAKVMKLRNVNGLPFRQIATALSFSPADIEVRYRILQRLQETKESASRQCTLPCMICRKPFVTPDRRRIRFCEPCRKGEVPARVSSPYDPDCVSGCGTAAPALPVGGGFTASLPATEVSSR